MSPDDRKPVKRAANALGALVALRTAVGALRSRKPPPPPPAPTRSVRREMPSPPSSIIPTTCSVCSSSSSVPRSSTWVSCGTTNLPATMQAAARRHNAPPIATPSN